MARPALLLDSPSLAYRAYFALPSSIRAPDGSPVNAVRGYLDMVTRLRTDRDPAGVVHVFDADWRPAFRVARHAGYKANRPPDPVDLPPQFAVIREVLEAAGEEVAEAAGYEADDVIGTLAVAATDGAPVEIVTGDRDLLQLVRDPAVVVLFTVKGVRELARYDEAAVRARYGVPPDLYPAMAALRGDPSDGLPGIAGVGERTAARLITEHGSLDGVEQWARTASGRVAAAVAAGAAYLEAMRVVVPVVTDTVPAVAPFQAPDLERLRRLGREHGIEGPIDRLLASRAAA